MLKPESCVKCKGRNGLTGEIYEAGALYEAQTKCTKCGFEDYWAYGCFEDYWAYGCFESGGVVDNIPANRVCHIVSACVYYEGCNPIAVFSSQDEADKFKKLCEDYQDAQPGLRDSSGREVSLEEYRVAHRSWLAAHPGGDICSFVDKYIVSDVPYYSGRQRIYRGRKDEKI